MTDAQIVAKMTKLLDKYRVALEATVPALVNIVEGYEPDTTEHQLCIDALRKVRAALKSAN